MFVLWLVTKFLIIFYLLLLRFCVFTKIVMQCDKLICKSSNSLFKAVLKLIWELKCACTKLKIQKCKTVSYFYIPQSIYQNLHQIVKRVIVLSSEERWSRDAGVLYCSLSLFLWKRKRAAFILHWHHIWGDKAQNIFFICSTIHQETVATVRF